MTSTDDDRITLMGAPGSPYTRKMLALLRYRHIPYNMLWGGHQNPPAGYPSPKVKLLPTFYFKSDTGELEAMVDSTPIIRRLESERPGRSVLPEDGVLRFLCDLIEDYADEWLTKCMFHFRWAHEADWRNAGPLLVYWSMPTLDADAARKQADYFTKRQIDRLYVVGSNEVTAETIEASYERLIALLDDLLGDQGYVLGRRPSAADFALFGQLTQLAVIEPTSAAITNRVSQRVRAWIDRVEDLSGLQPDPSDWMAQDEVGGALRPLLTEIGRVYAPFLLANAKAAAAGEETFDTEIDGRRWTQPVFPYQAKCLHWLREGRNALNPNDQARLDNILQGTGCEALFA